MSGSYQKLLEVLKKWPLDKSKGLRDYGSYLRKLAQTTPPTQGIFPGTHVEVNDKIEALLRLTEDKYKKMYGSNRTHAASGLTARQLHQALSEDVVNKYFKS